MKRYTLVLSLLFAAPLMAAVSFQEGKQKVEGASEGVKRVQQRVAELKKSMDDEVQKSHALAGKEENGDALRACQRRLKVLEDKYNRAAVEEMKQAREHLQRAIKEVGRSHYVVSDGDTHTVTRNKRTRLKPIVREQRS